MMLESEIQDQIQPLLAKASLDTHILSLQPCAQGGNNRTYRLTTRDGVFVLKKYFRQASDMRDRLTAEYIFLQYANKVAAKWVPLPFSLDIVTGMALYEFIEGQPITTADLTVDDIHAASDFFCALNQPMHALKAHQLPQASEACFSLQEHLDLIDHRVKTLLNVELSSDDIAAKSIIHQINTRWEISCDRIIDQARAESIDLLAKLPHEQRCVSPSDFGFHNALRVADGSLRFLDFEYAGWDDPAKMIGDFFSQLAVPVPAKFFTNFVEKNSIRCLDHENLAKRTELLRPAYQIKWCCIALNIFIPVNLARRQFANPGLNVEELKEKQLAKAQWLLNQQKIS